MIQGRKVPPRRRHTPGEMNDLEAAYSRHLEHLKRIGEVLAWRFEAVKFRLAKKTFYSPDFLVTYTDRMELHEVKGHWEDDARVKIKVAAEAFPEFGFVAVQKYKKTEAAIYGEWRFEHF